MRIERWLMAAALTVYATPSVAQLQYSTTVDLNSTYTARGVTWTNRPVVQPSLALNAEFAGIGATLGAWANIEPTAYDDAADLSSRNGLPGPSEFDLSLGFARSIGGLDLAIGTIWFVYPRHERYAGGPNTVEATFSASVPALPLSPVLDVYYEMIAAPGVYAQLAISQQIPAHRPVLLDAALGFSQGQADPHDHASYYAGNGLTHVELGAAVPFAAGRLTVTPSLRGVHAIDEAVRVTGPARRQDFKLLLGASLSWAGAGF